MVANVVYSAYQAVKDFRAVLLRTFIQNAKQGVQCILQKLWMEELQVLQCIPVWYNHVLTLGTHSPSQFLSHQSPLT